jgi:deazaflavin-dependent oxidoreductase (nitroreductase family)
MTEAAPAPIVDSDLDWVKKQIDEYIATDGVSPVFRYGAPLVLITVKGRKSGKWMRTCLIGTSDGTDVVIVASKGGSPENPGWYRNIEANPRVWVQQGAESFWTTAHTATAEEKPPLWDLMVGLYPDYADYQTKTDRQIPVVVLRRD